MSVEKLKLTTFAILNRPKDFNKNTIEKIETFFPAGQTGTSGVNVSQVRFWSLLNV